MTSRQAFRNVDDVLRKEAGCTTELDDTEQSSWLLFLKYLDGLEQDRADKAKLSGKKYAFMHDPGATGGTRAAGQVAHRRLGSHRFNSKLRGRSNRRAPAPS